MRSPPYSGDFTDWLVGEFATNVVDNIPREIRWAQERPVKKWDS
ncbi:MULTISPECIES: hypothetical protein [Pirellulaceae]|nr:MULTISPECIES: hypothetical protein [Pirellulaceae]